MDSTLNSIEDAVDRKFLITKSLKGQAEMGTIIHVLDAAKKSNGGVKVKYRVTEKGEKYSYQDYTVKFDSFEDFTKWASTDNFIARHYEEFDIKDIQHYIKVNNRSFAFVLPFLVVALAVVWVVAMVAIKGTIGIAAGAALTIAAIIVSVIFFNKSKTNAKMKLYDKVSADWNVVIK